MPRLALVDDSGADAGATGAGERGRAYSGKRSKSYGTAKAALLPADSRRTVSWGMPMSQTPLIERFRKYHRPAEGDVGFLATMCFAINLVVGAGFLGIPRAFYDSGLVLGVIGTLVCAVACDITKNSLLETMARAEALSTFRLTGSSRADSGPSAAMRASLEDAAYGAAAHKPLNSDVAVAVAARSPTSPVEPEYHISDRRFELTELCDMFLGVWWKRLYLVCVCLFLGGVEWAFASVFASSFSANVPLWFLNGGEACNPDTGPDACRDNFHVYLGVFAAVVIPLSCVTLKEQKVLQVVMAMARAVIIVVMVATTVGGMFCDGVSFAAADVHGSIAADVQAFRFSGLKTLIPVIVYSLVVHPGIPTLSQPSECRDRRLSDVFTAAFTSMVVCYLVSGVVIALYFGGAITPQANLQWESYVGCIAGEHGTVSGSDAGIGAKALRFFILIFPGLDVMSAYPLQAITMGNNLLSAWAGEQAPKAAKMRRVSIVFRLMAAIPPLVGCFFVRNLDKIESVTGVIGFGVAFFIPIALARSSARQCVDTFGAEAAGPGPAATSYRSRLYFPGIDWIVAGVFTVVAVYALVNGIISVV